MFLLAFALRSSSFLRINRVRQSIQTTASTPRRPRAASQILACERAFSTTSNASNVSNASISSNSSKPLTAVSYFSPVSRKTSQQSHPPDDTIYALATGPVAAAGVAVIRISGPAATHALKSLLSPTGKRTLPKPRTASLRALHHPHTGDLLDRALVLHFPAPRSFTTEDVVELHLHGSRAVIAAVTEALADIPKPKIRPANRGEFTRRAFENGAMDLVNVEALADLIAAETTSQRQQALRQLSGDTAVILSDWRRRIINALAHVEAVIDFADDVGESPFAEVIPEMRVLRDEMENKMKQDRRAEIVRTGARIAIVGPPNAGKSSLLNAFAKRPAAIVSATAGTTRDVLDVRMDLSGLAVTISDTAGLREGTNDDIEVEGMRRARIAASDADIVLCVQDVSSAKNMAACVQDAKETLVMSEANDKLANAHIIYVLNKTDLRSDRLTEIWSMDSNDCDVFETSVLQNKGITELIMRVEAVLKNRLQTGENENDTETAPVITRARHRHHVENAVKALSSFIDGQMDENVARRMPMDLAAEDLRISSKEVGAITGMIDTEEVLDVVFSEFCIGK